MTRRKRYKQCLFWRGFISKVNKMAGYQDLKKFLFSLSEVESIQIEHGWETWVAVQLKDGSRFVDRAVLPLDCLKKVCKEIYRYAVGEYLTYVKSLHT